MIQTFENFLKSISYPQCAHGLTNEELETMIAEDCLRIVREVNDKNDSVRNRKGDFEFYYSHTHEPISVWIAKNLPDNIFKLLHDLPYDYRLSDIGTNKVYHGKTDRQIRIIEHVENSKGEKSDRLMCEDFSKDGCVLEILFVCETMDEARKVESMYNERLKYDGTNEYSYNSIK